MATWIHPELHEKLNAAGRDKRFEVDILLTGSPGEGELDAKTPRLTIVDALTKAAHGRQAGVVAYLRDQEKTLVVPDKGLPYPAAQVQEQFWLTNSVSAVVSADVLRTLIERDDVEAIEESQYSTIEELIDAPPAGGVSVVTAAGIGWGVERINAPLLWDHGIDGTGALVAVLDSGVNYRHPDLRARMWQSGDPALPNHGFNFAQNNGDPIDDNAIRHGTSCAGIVAGDGTSGTRTGVAPGATIMALKIGGSENNFRRAIEFAIQRGADVVSMSLTVKNQTNLVGWRRACNTLRSARVCHASSSGNEGMNLAFPVPRNIGPPGNCPPPWLNPAMPARTGLSSAVTCGATRRDERRIGISGLGPAQWNVGAFSDYPNPPGLVKPDVCAPGAETPTCNGHFGSNPAAAPYRDFGGTSGATPHVAGAMALLVQATKRANLDPDPARILEALESTAVRIPNQTQAKQNHFGAGRIDVFAAFEFGRQRGWWH
jgi:subtilisin family serine protease